MSTGIVSPTHLRDPWFRKTYSRVRHNSSLWVALLWLFLFPALLICACVSGYDVFQLRTMTFFCLPFLLAGGTIWLSLSYAQARLSRRFRLVLVLISLGLALSIPVTLWPFRVVFPWYQGQLEHLADRVQRGYIVARPQRFGPVTVYKASIFDSRGVVLWTDAGCDHGLLHAPNGPGGFLSSGSCGYVSGAWWLVAED